MSAPPPTPTPFINFDPDAVASRYDFPDNLGEGVVHGILAWGDVGTIGVSTQAVTAHIQEHHPDYQPNFRVICLGGQHNNEATTGELFMDSVISGWYLPKADAINIYIATTETLADAIAQAVSDGCAVTTSSFGVHSKDAVNSVDAALREAVAAGLTPCFASGDFGAASGGFVDDVTFPAASPFAVAVGGTFVPQATGVESVWWNYPASPGHPPWWGSGGGVSTLYGVPDFQASLNPTQPWSPEHSGRGVPDVAALAQGNDGWVGTSAATPTFAALMARIVSALGFPVGDIHDVIYAPPAGTKPFVSITTGNNIPPPGVGHPTQGYEAQAGWDACTGVGVPDGAQLLAALRAARSPR